MKLETLTKKVELLTRNYRAKKLADFKKEKRRKNASEYWLKQLERDTTKGHPFALNYRKRSGVFVNYKGSCALDLVNETGHSYGWWSMLRRIKGKLCLNTYAYSVQTSKHINKARNVLRLLNISVLAIDAPRGLQDLESAANYAANEMGTAIVAEKYARKKSRHWIKYCEQRITNLAKIGVRVTKAMIEQGVITAESDRAYRLEQARKNRMRIIDNATEADRDKKGYHVIRNENDYLGSRQKRELAREALDKGFHALYIHRVAKLEVIEGGAA